MCEEEWKKKVRKIYGQEYEKAASRIKNNREIYFNFPGIVTVIKVRSLEWLGHAVMKDRGMAVTTLL
jgi:hypothetical protein